MFLHFKKCILLLLFKVTKHHKTQGKKQIPGQKHSSSKKWMYIILAVASYNTVELQMGYPYIKTLLSSIFLYLF